MTTAFVLGGGGVLGAVEVGMLRALFERGVVADLLVGTSVGALNAAFLASRPQRPDTAQALARVWRDLHREHIFPVNMRALLGGLRGQRDHLVTSRGVRRLVQRHVEFDDLVDATVPLHVVAFDVVTGRDVLLSSGSALEAIAASTAIPGVFPAVKLGERYLIDGGVVNNTPISHAVELGAERIYVLPTQAPDRALGQAPHSALDTASYGLGLLLDGRLEADIARYSKEAELIVLPVPNTMRVAPTEFMHSGHLMREAHACSRAWLSSVPAGSDTLGAAAEVEPRTDRRAA
jgi:NTE family protein